MVAYFGVMHFGYHMEALPFRIPIVAMFNIEALPKRCHDYLERHIIPAQIKQGIRCILVHLLSRNVH